MGLREEEICRKLQLCSTGFKVDSEVQQGLEDFVNSFTREVWGRFVYALVEMEFPSTVRNAQIDVVNNSINKKHKLIKASFESGLGIFKERF